MFTYGDGFADLDIRPLLEFYKGHGKLAPVTTAHSPARFGRLALKGGKIVEFHEKPEASEGWINGGFFVLNGKAIDHVDENLRGRDAVERLARHGQLMGFRHYGFRYCVDTIKGKNMLEELWASGKAPWKVWPRLWSLMGDGL